jgi:hypothetical protein
MLRPLPEPVIVSGVRQTSFVWQIFSLAVIVTIPVAVVFRSRLKTLRGW